MAFNEDQSLLIMPYLKKKRKRKKKKKDNTCYGYFKVASNGPKYFSHAKHLKKEKRKKKKEKEK